MAYLEPGVYSKTVSLRPNTGTGGPRLVPLVIGSGDTKIKSIEVLTRGSGVTDTLPKQALEILSVGYTSRKADFTLGTDYKINEADASKVEWLATVGAKAPAAGESYSVTYISAVPADQYVPRVIEKYEQLETYYGTEYKVDGTLNNIFIAGEILVKMGVSEFIMLQVDPGEEGVITGTDYQKALDKYAQYIEEIWRIVPADLGTDINAVIDGHVTKCSSYEERKERCAVYAREDASTLTTAEDVIEKVGAYAHSKYNERISTIYPATATMTMNSGAQETLTGQFIAAAYVGLEFTLPLYKSKTRATTGIFDQLLGVQLTRREKNKLAEKGVIIFEQPGGADTNIICRHQLTTNMDSAEYRENSILACKDYTSKYLRSILETYIGKYNVTADTITKITGSVNAAFASLITDQYLIEGQIVNLAQDEFNPDSLILDVRVKVPYPCNYIKLTIMTE